MQKRKIVVVGAGSSIARHCIYEWMSRSSTDFFLVGRDSKKLEQLRNDILVRDPTAIVDVDSLDFNDVTRITESVSKIFSLAEVNIVLIAHGFLPDQELCKANLSQARQALEINGVSVVLFAAQFIQSLMRQGHGTLVVISSVAADRGRKSNYFFGAAKSMVSTYMQGLQHDLLGTNIKAVLVKPGPTKTPMTANLQNVKYRMASVEKVAKDIVDGVERTCLTIYTPAKWAMIMWIIKHLPDSIYRRLNI